MGSRANSYLGFGLVFNEWDEETHGDCPFELSEKIEEREEDMEARVLGDACENQIFLAIKESFISGDWDDPEEISIEKIKQKSEWSSRLFEVCKHFGIDFKEAKLLMISDFG